MNAETIAKALGGRKAGGAWMACCPAHDDREPSLSITDAKGGKVLVRCHAGCDQHDVIAALRSRGLWATDGRHAGRALHNVHRRLHARPDPNALTRTEAALAIWPASRPAKGTPLKTYLRSRWLNLSLPVALRLPAVLDPPWGRGRPALPAAGTPRHCAP